MRSDNLSRMALNSARSSKSEAWSC